MKRVIIEIALIVTVVVFCWWMAFGAANPPPPGGSSSSGSGGNFGNKTRIVMAIQGDSWSDKNFMTPPWDTVIRTQYFSTLTIDGWTNIATAGYTTADASNGYPMIHAMTNLLNS